MKTQLHAENVQKIKQMHMTKETCLCIPCTDIASYLQTVYNIEHACEK